jgi:hypothetical protein
VDNASNADFAEIGAISFALTVINIVCIYIFGMLMFAIKVSVLVVLMVSDSFSPCNYSVSVFLIRFEQPLLLGSFRKWHLQNQRAHFGQKISELFGPLKEDPYKWRNEKQKHSKNLAG